MLLKLTQDLAKVWWASLPHHLSNRGGDCAELLLPPNIRDILEAIGVELLIIYIFYYFYLLQYFNLLSVSSANFAERISCGVDSFPPVSELVDALFVCTRIWGVYVFHPINVAVMDLLNEIQRPILCH